MMTAQHLAKPGAKASDFGFRHLRHLYWYFAVWTGAVLLALLQPMAWAQQQAYPQGTAIDPPGRVARLNLTEGPVSFLLADDASTSGNEWSAAQLNRPLTSGDKLWTGPQARSELYVGSTALRMSEQTSLDIQTLDDNTAQLSLAQGTLKLRVRSLFEGERLEVDTPNLAFVISRPGDYRLDVNPATNTTRVVAQSGGGMIYGDGSSAPINLGDQQQASFTGTQLIPATPGAAYLDSFDQWVAERDRLEDQSVSARYIPRETLGYQQLDSYGSWSQDPGYGAIWFPRAVPLNWAPYRLGHWAWVSPWGWTWVDDAPWGFAPFHYGRWAQIGPRWAWVPGRLAPRPAYAPALVGFIGGSSGGVNWSVAVSSGTAQPSLGWFPLAPGEAFRPAYRVSPHYVSRVNNNIVINNTVNQTNVYRYQREAGAVTAVSRDDFVRGRPVREAQHMLSPAELNRAPLLANRSPILERPALLREPERSRPLAPAALPPAAVVNRPVVSLGARQRDERRANGLENRQESRPERAGAPEDQSRITRPDGRPRLLGLPAQGQAPAAAQAPAAIAPPAPPVFPQARPQAQERAAAEMDQRNPRALQREQQRQPAEESLGQRALREQAQKNAMPPAIPAIDPEARAAANRNAAAEQQQQQQLRQQQQEQQQRALQNQQRQAQEQQAQRAQEQQIREQQQLHQQQQDQQRAMQAQQRQAQEQQQLQHQQAMQQQQQQLRQQQQEQQRALQAQQRQAQEQQPRQAPPPVQQREQAPPQQQPQQPQQADPAAREAEARGALQRRLEEARKRNREQ